MEKKQLFIDTVSNKEYSMLKSACEKYGFDIKDAYKVRSAYRVFTSGNKSLCIKRMKNGRRKILNGNKLVEGLHEVGFYNTPKYLRTTHGNLYIKHKKVILCATEWVDGKESDLDDINEACNCAKLLAEFHISSNKLNSKEFKIKNNLKNWPTIFSSNLNEIERFKKIINNKRLKNQFDYRYLEYIDKFQLRGLNALNILNTSSYYKISRVASKNHTICHDSFYYQNIIKKEDEYYIIDLDNILVDLQVNDLGKYIRRLMYKRKYKWDFEKAREIIEAYSAINHLGKEELEVMLSLIMFPHKFWKLGKKRYVNHKNWSESKYTHKLEKIIKFCELEDQFFIDYMNYLKDIR